MYASQLCRKALRSINAYGVGVAPTPDDLQVAFEALNDMIDAWAAIRLTIFQTLIFTYVLTANKGGPTPGSSPYTIGPGGDFDQPRPLWIPNANLLVTNTPQNYEVPLEILTDDEYARIAIKNLGNTLATCLWYNGRFNETGADAGLGEIYLWMIPNGGLPVSLVLYSPIPLTQFADQNATDYHFPPGYAEAIRYQLALRLAPEFAKEVTPELMTLATQTFAVIQRPNAKMPTLRSDIPMPGRATGLYDWRTGSSSRRGVY